MESKHSQVQISSGAITVDFRGLDQGKLPVLPEELGMGRRSNYIPRKLIEGIKGKDLVLLMPNNKTKVYANADLEKHAEETISTFKAGDKDLTKLSVMQKLVELAKGGEPWELDEIPAIVNLGMNSGHRR